jgi:hypothetical protein
MSRCWCATACSAVSSSCPGRGPTWTSRVHRLAGDRSDWTASPHERSGSALRGLLDETRIDDRRERGSGDLLPLRPRPGVRRRAEANRQIDRLRRTAVPACGRTCKPRRPDDPGGRGHLPVVHGLRPSHAASGLIFRGGAGGHPEWLYTMEVLRRDSAAQLPAQQYTVRAGLICGFSSGRSGGGIRRPVTPGYAVSSARQFGGTVGFCPSDS